MYYVLKYEDVISMYIVYFTYISIYIYAYADHLVPIIHLYQQYVFK